MTCGQAIAKQVGIIESDQVDNLESLHESESHDISRGIVIKGAELDNLKEREWNSILDRRQIVFARSESITFSLQVT
jgi:magnesium-transporting ATPase (P-type)